MNHDWITNELIVEYAKCICIMFESQIENRYNVIEPYFKFAIFLLTSNTYDISTILEELFEFIDYVLLIASGKNFKHIAETLEGKRLGNLLVDFTYNNSDLLQLYAIDCITYISSYKEEDNLKIFDHASLLSCIKDHLGSNKTNLRNCALMIFTNLIISSSKASHMLLNDREVVNSIIMTFYSNLDDESLLITLQAIRNLLSVVDENIFWFFIKNISFIDSLIELLINSKIPGILNTMRMVFKFLFILGDHDIFYSNEILDNPFTKYIRENDKQLEAFLSIQYHDNSFVRKSYSELIKEYLIRHK